MLFRSKPQSVAIETVAGIDFNKGQGKKSCKIDEFICEDSQTLHGPSTTEPKSFLFIVQMTWGLHLGKRPNEKHMEACRFGRCSKAPSRNGKKELRFSRLGFPL